MDILDKILLLIQIGCYFTSILLVFVDPVQFFEIVLQFSFFAASFMIKVLREGLKKNLKHLLKNQMGFCIAYLLVGMELLFLYRGMQKIFDKTTILWTLLVIIMQNMNYSLLMHENTANYLELILYSAGLVFHVVMSVKGNLLAIEYFDSAEGLDYIKDMILLFIATVIAEGILVLDLIYRVYQRKQWQKIKEIKSSLNFELLKIEFKQ